MKINKSAIVKGLTTQPKQVKQTGLKQGSKVSKVDGGNRLHKRCTWLSVNVFGKEGAIDAEAIKGLRSIDYQRAMQMTKELEDKAASISNPSGYLKAAVKREPKGSTGAGAPSDAEYSKVHKRCTWLASQKFGDKDKIDMEAIAALSTVGFERAMEITEGLEKKAASVSNPSGYIKAAVKRDLSGAVAGLQAAAQNIYLPSYSNMPKQASAQPAYSNIHKRCTWLGANVFGNPTAIDDEAIGALASIDPARAKELTDQLQEKGTSIANPSGWLKVAVKKEVGGGSRGDDKAAYSAIHKRCTWLASNVFGDKDAIDLEAIAALASLEFGRAMEITESLEAKGGDISNPSGYLKVAAQRELNTARGDNKHNTSTIHKRCTWLGANIFEDKAAIDEDAIAALASIDIKHALEITKELEAKGTSVKNPSGYIKTAVKNAMGASLGGSPKASPKGSLGGSLGGFLGGPNMSTDDEQYSKVHKRCTWVGSQIFGSKDAIDIEAIRELSRLDFARVMDITTSLAQKGSSIENPSGYLKAAVKRELGGGAPPGKKAKR